MQDSFMSRLVYMIAILWVGRGFTQAQSATGDALRAQACYLRGLGWYNLNTAKATSINVDSAIRWKTDLRKIQRERWDLDAQRVAEKKLKIEEVRQQQLERELRLRVDPSSADVEKGDALNVLVYDLTDPDIKSSDWSSKTVPLPEGLSVKDLIFRFTPQSGSSKSSAALSKGVIALSRLDIEGKWPTVVKMEALDRERAAYENAYAKVRDQILNGEFNLNVVLEMDRTLTALQEKVKTAVPVERGFRVEAQKFVEDLKASTRLFDAETVDYAREILIDTKDHDATTVAELVSFMLKYRLQFATAERSSTARELYTKLHEALRQQATELGIKPPEMPEANPKRPADAVTFKGRHYKAFADVLTWHDAKRKCEEMGGRLAVIKSPEQNAFITKLTGESKIAVVWLGATDEKNEGRWEWLDGSIVKYHNWDPNFNQPNNASSVEHYMTLIAKKGLWNDYPDDAKLYPMLTGAGLPGFVCEWE